MRMRQLAFLVVVAFTGGCVSGSGQPNSQSPGAAVGTAEPVAPGDVDPNSPFGIVQGTIVNEETNPISGAQVALQNTSHATTTDAAGVFVLRDVEPGKYVLLVGALGYESSGRPIDVQAAQISSVSFVLRAVEAAGIVYHETFHNTGFFECALQVPVWVSSCSYPYTAVYGTLNDSHANPGLPKDVENNIHRFNITVRPTMGNLVAELVWTPASAASSRMQMIVMCGYYDPVWDDCVDPPTTGDSLRYNDSNGPSPVRVVVESQRIKDLGKGHDKFDLSKHPIWIMNYVGLPFGCIELDVTKCVPGLPGNEVQLAFQQRFDVWDTVFYNGDGPPDFTVITTG